MKLTIVITVLLALAPSARAGVAYYRPQAAAAASAEGKKNAADEKADLDAKTAEVKKASDDANSAQAKCDKAPRTTPEAASCADAHKKATYVQQLDAARAQQYQQAQAAHAKHLAERIERIAAAVRRARKLDALIAVFPGSDLATTVDLTAEFVRRLDAGDGKGDDELATENAELKAKVAALEAKDKASAPSPNEAKKPPEIGLPIK